MITAGTCHKLHHFRDSERLTYLTVLLMELAIKYGWSLQAWAVFSNHYHFIAKATPNATAMREMITELHARSAKEVNQQDMTPGRQVWYQFWDRA